MVNTILELADVDGELSTLAARELARVEAVFEACFERAQKVGDYPAERSASDLAAYVMLMNQGLRVASRKRKRCKVECPYFSSRCICSIVKLEFSRLPATSLTPSSGRRTGGSVSSDGL